jgi:hypothetical protein
MPLSVHALRPLSYYRVLYTSERPPALASALPTDHDMPQEVVLMAENLVRKTATPTRLRGNTPWLND